MLSMVLNIIGLICIIISLIFINKTFKKEMDIYEEIILIHNNVKDYSAAMENVLTSFDELMESSLEKIEFIEKNIAYDDIAEMENIEVCHESNEIILEELNIDNDSTKEFYKKVLDLNNIGLPNEEIARKLNIGVREVEIMLKMWNNNNI